MLSFFDVYRDINLVNVLVRLLMAVLCGGAIGLERSYKNRPAGFRTHILVCIGAAIASMTGIFMYINMQLPTDISRIGAQVVSGLGFIGGGTIIVVNNKKIKGLTTAAGLWVCGIIGLAIGAGFFEGAILATVLVLVAEIVFSILGGRISHNEAFRLELSYNDKTALNHVMRYCKNNRMIISNLEVTGTSDHHRPEYSVTIHVRTRKKIDHSDFIAYIRDIKGVTAASISNFEKD
ncbi:MAG: MgtC/SapB family protein [Clostridiales bacterium]|nr:MgtC/SapB family protein [Clostridiales bacterium]